MKIVRVLAAFFGYFRNPFGPDGYGLTAFESRSRRVSQGKDYLEAWHQVKEGLREVALIAEDHGVVLALQTHPEITDNNDDTLEMIEEVGVASLKVGLDLPLLESQDPDFIRDTVRRMKDLMVYSHTISITPKFTVGGAPCGWYEVEPGAEDDLCDWETFMAACQENGYDGYLSAEQCSPIGTVDERYVASLEYLKGIALKLGCYTGHKGLEPKS
jgi:sugar phosphate isomerase/epimerase